MRSVFGWSLPPGCRTLPGEEPVGPCETCGGDPEGDSCVCPECHVCHLVGNTVCYDDHGLVYSAEQLAGQARLAEEYRLQSEADAIEAETHYDL